MEKEIKNNLDIHNGISLKEGKHLNRKKPLITKEVENDY
jgi:hypothetical protein